MLEIISPKQAKFVECFLREPRTHGAATRAARKAGFGTANSSPQSMATISSRLMRRPEIAHAISRGFVCETSPTCPTCGARFQASGLKKYCSAECAREAYRARHALIPTNVVCRVCLVKFKGKKMSVYCSEVCRQVGHRRAAQRRYKPRQKWTDYSSGNWVRKAKAAIQALEDLGIEI